MKISTLIFASFLFILLLFSITTYINYRQSEAVKDYGEYITTSTELVRNTSRFQRNMLNMVSGLRGYLLTGEKYFIQSYDSAAIENETILAELPRLVTDSLRQSESIKEIQNLNNRWIEDYAQPLRQAKTLAIINDSNLLNFQKVYREKVLYGQEKQIQMQLQQTFRDFSNEEYANREGKKQSLAALAQRTRLISLYLTVFSVIGSLLIMIFVARRISSRISKMVNLANEIASGNYTVTITDTGKDELSELSQSLNHMAHELEENISELRKKNEELDQFAHIVSHDLKGPLRGIDNVVTWIDEDHSQELNPKMKEYLQIIKGRVNRTENLIEGILSYARIGKETMPGEFVNINQLIGEILENVPPETTLTFDIQPDLPAMFTEKIPLFQIFSNIIGNAIKYHDKPNGIVRVYYKDRVTHYEFFVEDNGPGIAKNYHNRIFVIFQTLKERDTFESTGVGLAIVRKILDARKETISIVSEPGQGSIFSFTWLKV